MNASVRRPTRLEAVVLGLLVERPAHGYGLKARLGPGLPRERRINDGVLYPLLARLERLGLASSSERHDGARKRRVYAATAAGEAAFREWLRGDRDEGAGLDHELFIDHPLIKLSSPARSPPPSSTRRSPRCWQRRGSGSRRSMRFPSPTAMAPAQASAPPSSRSGALARRR